MKPTRVMPYFVILCFLLVACAGCQTTPAKPTYTEMRAKLQTVTLADGISQSEAVIIGQCYFYKNVGCGAYYDVRDGNDRWIVDGGVGYAPQPVRFCIDKHSGKIFDSSFGPNYNNPLAILP